MWPRRGQNQRQVDQLGKGIIVISVRDDDGVN